MATPSAISRHLSSAAMPTNFSVGANLMQLLLSMQEGEWDDVDLAVRAFQRMTASIKFCPRPVVAAPFGFCLGGGAEIALACDPPPGPRGAVHGAGGDRRRRAARGRRLQGDDATCRGRGAHSATVRAAIVELMEALKQNFETVAMAKVSTSAMEARRLGLSLRAIGITMNRERLLADAKQLARDIAAIRLRGAGAADRYPGSRRERAGDPETRAST